MPLTSISPGRVHTQVQKVSVEVRGLRDPAAAEGTTNFLKYRPKGRSNHSSVTSQPAARRPAVPMVVPAVDAREGRHGSASLRISAGPSSLRWATRYRGNRAIEHSTRWILERPGFSGSWDWKNNVPY